MTGVRMRSTACPWAGPSSQGSAGGRPARQMQLRFELGLTRSLPAPPAQSPDSLPVHARQRGKATFTATSGGERSGKRGKRGGTGRAAWQDSKQRGNVGATLTASASANCSRSLAIAAARSCVLGIAACGPGPLSV